MRCAAARARGLLLQQAERKLEVELRVLVRLVERQRAAELPRREQEEAQPLTRIVRRGEREPEDAQQIRRLRPTSLARPLADVLRERDRRLAPDRIDVRVQVLVRGRLREVEVTQRLPVEEVVVDREQPLRSVERHERVGLPQVEARRLHLEAHVVAGERRVPASDVDGQQQEADPRSECRDGSDEPAPAHAAVLGTGSLPFQCSLAASAASTQSASAISVHGVWPPCAPCVCPRPPLVRWTGCTNAPGPARFLNSERLSVRGATATIRNGTPSARNWLKASATRGTSSGAVSRSLTRRIGPFGSPAGINEAGATASPDEICVPPEKLVDHGFGRNGSGPGLGRVAAK